MKQTAFKTFLAALLASVIAAPTLAQNGVNPSQSRQATPPPSEPFGRAGESGFRPPVLVRKQPVSEPQSFDAEAFGRVFTHRMATVNGVKLHYVIGGRGEPLVLLHGWPDTWFLWWRMMPELAKRYTVIAPDLRGLGDSERAASGYDKATLADDVYKLVRGLGYERIHLVGHDWGAATAFVLAQEHPEFVRKLVLSENVIPGINIRGIDDFDEGARGIWWPGFLNTPEIPEAVITGRERQFYTPILRSWAYNKSAVSSQSVDEFVRAYSIPGTTRTAAEYYRTLGQDAQHNQRYNDRKFRMPVLVVTGSQFVIPDVLHLQLEPLADDYRGVVLEGVGHFAPLEAPREFLSELLPFLSK